MKATYIALLAGTLTATAFANPLGDPLKKTGIYSRNGSFDEYTVRFVSPPIGKTAAYATFAENGKEEHFNLTFLARNSELYEITTILDAGADNTPDWVVRSSGKTLKEAFEQIGQGKAQVSVPDADNKKLFEEYTASILRYKEIPQAR